MAFIAALLSLLTIATSCTKDEFGTYEFLTNTNVQVREQGRASLILESIYSDEYFCTTHSYTAKYSEAVCQAADEFDLHIKKLDTDFIESKLQMDERVTISLWSMNPGQRWLTYVITPGMTQIYESDN